MIRPQELKIGNLFHSTNRIKGIKMPFGVAKVLTLGVFDLEWLPPDQIPAQVEVWNKSRYSEIDPISLTPEWLKKFGFHRQTENHYYIFYMDKVLITIYNGSLVIEGGFIPLDLKYVHQLQNLYWSLCGEELTIVSQEQIQPPKTEAQQP